MSDGVYTETAFLVYLYQGEDEGQEEGTLTFWRREFVRHAPGVQVTREMVREHMEGVLHHYPHSRYRAIPDERVVDLTVRSTVVLP